MAFNINDYEPVEDRLARFWADNPQGRIETILVHRSEVQFIIRAEVYRDRNDDVSSASGYAEEMVETNNRKSVNFSSALENCETSAIGRALANMGYAPKSKRPSREEMTKVERIQNASPVRLNLEALKVLLQKYSSDTEERKVYVLRTLGISDLVSLNALTDEQIEKVTVALQSGSAPFENEGR